MIRGVVCLTYHLFRGGSPEAEPAVGHVRKNRTCPVINSTPKSLLRERKSRSGTRSRACRKKTDMPRYKFHANVEASIPSAPSTQLMMSRTNYEAVADFAGHWLHRAQVSLLTGEIGQIKLSHIRKKKTWCGPGAGSKTEAAEPASLQDQSRGAGALRNIHWTKAAICKHV